MKWIFSLCMLTNLFAMAEVFTPIVRVNPSTQNYCANSKPDDVCHMFFENARAYCKDQGYRLPEDVEIAQLSIAHGSKGFVNTCENHSNCTRWTVVKEDGSTKRYFFDYSGYQKPEDKSEHNWFWSNTMTGWPYVVSFSGLTGAVLSANIVNGNHSYTGAVRCIKN